jgi:thiamine kinase-like enzyme
MKTQSKLAPFLLGTHNVIDYLAQSNFFKFQPTISQKIELKACKNFNLVVETSPDRYVLVKQEPHNEDGQTHGDLAYEWFLHQLLQGSSTLGQITDLMSEFVAFDQARSIAIFNYLTHYCDLDQFYTDRRQFPTCIAAALGSTLAHIHRATFNEPTLQLALAAQNYLDTAPDFGHALRQLKPDIFGRVTSDGLKFYELYQRYDSLWQAIDRLSESYHSCCITHQDLKFNNILLHDQWQVWATTVEPQALQRIDRSAMPAMPSPIFYQENAIIRLIDWEKWTWGDPAFDVGTIIASYLKIWLKSLTLSAGIPIEMALRLAVTPLDVLQPSLRAFMRSYVAQFPQILQECPNFLTQVMQFTGLALIESLQARIQYYEPFGNVGIAMLEVAKALLCSPEPSIATIFGMGGTDWITSGETGLDETVWSSLQPVSRNDSVQPEPDRQNALIVPEERCNFNLMTQLQLHAIPKQNSQSHTVIDVLQDIAAHIHCLPDGQIYHDRHKPLELPQEIRDRFEKFPQDLKQSFLTTQLRNYLYDLYYSGEHLINHELDHDSPTAFHKNDTVRGINLEFYQSIDRANSGKGYFDPGWRLIAQKKDKEHDRGRIVQKNGLSLHVSRQQLAPNDLTAAIGDGVAVQLPHNLLESDFYVAVSNCGPVNDDRPALELCFNVTATGAIELMRRLTHGLNRLAIPFTFKVLLHPTAYQRYDTGILHLECQHYTLVRPLLQHSYLVTQSHFRSTTPFLTKRLAPGLSLAEEPLDGPEFGLHRCQLLAEALLAAQAQGHDTPNDRMGWIERSFNEQGISLQFPYLNGAAGANSDPYMPLDRC